MAKNRHFFNKNWKPQQSAPQNAKEANTMPKTRGLAFWAEKLFLRIMLFLLDVFLLRYIFRLIAAHNARLCGRKNHGADYWICCGQHWMGCVVLGRLRSDGGLTQWRSKSLIPRRMRWPF